MQDMINKLMLDNPTIVFTYKSAEYCRQYGLNNNCASSGDEVMIGSYGDSKLLYISILHEIGHIKEDYKRNPILKEHMLDVGEVYAWRYAIENSKIIITDSIRDYVLKCLSSYFIKIWGSNDEHVGLVPKYRELAIQESLI